MPNIVQAKKWPMIMSGGSILVSAACYFLALTLSSEWLFVLGYVFTPFVTTMAPGVDALLQRKSKVNPWFNAQPKYGKILQILAVVGLVVGGFHIYQIGVWIGAQFSQIGLG